MDYKARSAAGMLAGSLPRAADLAAWRATTAYSPAMPLTLSNFVYLTAKAAAAIKKCQAKKIARH